MRSARCDPIGRLRRVGPDGRTLVHAGAQLMAEYDGATLARRHVFAPGLDEPLVTYSGGSKTFHVADERGSVVAATDAAGMVVTSWGYGPHGEPDSRGLPQRFGFTGAPILAPLALTQMRARTYSHNLGRFLQPDPIGQAGGLNLYDYAGGDPINGWDPWGLEAKKKDGTGVITFPINPSKSNVEEGCAQQPCQRIYVTGPLTSVPSQVGYLSLNIGFAGRPAGVDQRVDSEDNSTGKPPPAFCSDMAWRGLDALHKFAKMGATGFSVAALRRPTGALGVTASAFLLADVGIAMAKGTTGDTEAFGNTVALAATQAIATRLLGGLAGLGDGITDALGSVSDTIVSVASPEGPCEQAPW